MVSQRVVRWETEIRAAAAASGLPPELVASLVEQESGGDPWAWNPEPRYPYLWDVAANRPFVLEPGEALEKSPPARFPRLAGDRDQEWWGQQASWGLLQLMGATARELGCRAPYLTVLCDAGYGLPLACAYLERLRRRWPETADFVSAYNAGRPTLANRKSYVDPVLARLGDYRRALGIPGS